MSTPPPLRPILTHTALLAVGVLVLACAGDGALFPKPALECSASSKAVDAYLGRIADLASNKARGDVLARHESGTISFALGADGSASDLRVVRASRPAVGQEVLRAAAAAAPYPRPPFDPIACLRGGRAEIGLFGIMRCDEARSNAYVDAVGTRILDAVKRAGITAAEREKIALRIKIDRQGDPAIAVQDAPSAESGERVASIARKLAPFEPPDDSIAECISDQAFFVWVELPGTSRPPVRIRER
jgi:hypothetical protein